MILQQYLYQQQMHWVRWAALDQARKETKAAAANAMITDEPRTITPPMDEKPLPAVPMTPSRPSPKSLNSVADIDGLLPPGQPRKTPTTKRVALEMLEDGDNDSDAGSQHSALGTRIPAAALAHDAARVAKQLRSTSPSGKTVAKTTTAVAGSSTKTTQAARAPAARTTRSTTRLQNNTVPRKAGVASHTRSATAITPLELNSRADRTTRPPAAATPHAASKTQASIPTPPAKPARASPSKIPARKLKRVASPPPTLSSTIIHVTASLKDEIGMKNSRLPTLVPSKRSFGGKPLPLTQSAVSSIGSVLCPVSEGSVATTKSQEDAWMSNTDVMEPDTKSGRPSLRRTRRRRSSFSNADIQ